MNGVHIFILNTLIENKKDAGTYRRPMFSIMVTQEGFEPPTL